MAVKKADETQAYTSPKQAPTVDAGAVAAGHRAPVKETLGQAQVQGGASGSGSSSGSSHFSYSGYTGVAPEVPESQLGDAPPAVQHETVPDAPDLRPELDRWLEAAQQQANNQIEYATQQGVTELERAQEDAQPKFQQMQNQISTEEQRALDNQALYAETRGDRGGVGQAQWNSIQNTAAQNRLQVQQQQTKMATDTARAIADLRAKGEFEKADKALELTQSYLSQLMQLEQWAASYNMSAAQFRESMNQFDADYRMQWARLMEERSQWEYAQRWQQYLTSYQQWSADRDFAYQQERDRVGDNQWQQNFDWNKSRDERDYNRSVYESNRDYNRSVYESDRNYNRSVYESDRDYDFSQTKWNYSTSQDQQEQLAGAGEALLSAGVMPSDSQLAAMGLTKEQAQLYINAMQLAATASGSSGSSGGGTPRRSSDNYDTYDTDNETPTVTPRSTNEILSSSTPTAAERGAVIGSLGADIAAKSVNNIADGLTYDKSSGKVTFGGKTYTSVTKFLNVINSSNLSKAQKDAIKEALDKLLGIDSTPKNSGGSGSGAGTGSGSGKPLKQQTQ